MIIWDVSKPINGSLDISCKELFIHFIWLVTLLPCRIRNNTSFVDYAAQHNPWIRQRKTGYINVHESLRQEVCNACVYVLYFESNKNNFDSFVLPSPLTFCIFLANIWTFIISWNKLPCSLLTEVHCFQPCYRPRVCILRLQPPRSCFSAVERWRLLGNHFSWYNLSQYRFFGY